jgi:S1-C subfamily serine protease
MFKWRIVLSLLLFVMAFFAGAAWKGNDNGEDTAAVQGPNRTVAPRGDLTSEEQHTIQLFQRTAPSVCFITTTAVRRDFWTRNIMEIPQGTGSGFVWDQQGHVVTNYHVIQGEGNRVKVTLSDRTTWDADIVGIAPEKDLAVLRIKAASSKLTPIQVGSSQDLLVGQAVYAIGNPFGLDQTLTTGIVSALGREIQSVGGFPIRDVIQSDAAINPGNSGGPLLDSSGRLIGVNTAIYSPSGASAGIGFSIPVAVVRWVIPELIQYGKIKRPSLGIEVLPTAESKEYDFAGPLVMSVVKGSSAERAGIRYTQRDRNGDIILGDMITAMNGKPIKSYEEMVLELEKYEAGQQVKLTVRRDKRELVIPVTLEESK